jgi:chromosome segregation ATPase
MNNEQHKPSFVIINGKEKELLTDKNQFTSWKINIAKQIEDKKDTLSEIEKTETSLRRILKEIDRFSSGELSSDIEKAMIHEQNTLLSLKTKLQEIKTQEEKERELQLELKQQLEKTNRKIEKLTKNVEKLEGFDQEKTLHQENKRVKLEKEKQKDALDSQQQEIGKEHQHTVELQNQWNQTYLEWKLTTEQNIKEISFFIEEAVFPAEQKADQSEEVPKISPHLLQ